MHDQVPAAQHSRECAIFFSYHDQAKDGRPGAFHAVPCDCHLSQ